ncbi:MAG: DUF2628 domain-containing protein [Magnetovibrio sp.]|nr:DUF2628 domain-containing protein [Magnetovibrio sp.]
MRVYSIHVRRHGLDLDRDLALVKEGFSWPAFLFAGIWALWNRMWLWAAVFLAVPPVIGVTMRGLGADPLAQSVVGFGWALIVGLVANDLKRAALERRGFVETGVAAGRGADEALYGYLGDTAAEPQKAVT